MSAGSGSRTKKKGFGAGDCTSVPAKFGECAVQKCDDVLCFGDVGAPASGERVAVVPDAVSVTRGRVAETRVKIGLERDTGNGLGELYFETVRDVQKGLGAICSVSKEWSAGKKFRSGREGWSSER